jgi:hypothetical protein
MDYEWSVDVERGERGLSVEECCEIKIMQYYSVLSVVYLNLLLLTDLYTH